MSKHTMLPVSDPSFEKCSKRIVVFHDTDAECSRKSEGDHLFVCWGNVSRYNLSDPGAECPFQEDKRDEAGRNVVIPGLYVFQVNMYDHSGLSFSLGGDPAQGFDPGGWDTTNGAAYLYCDKQRFIDFHGEGRWMKVPTDPEDLAKPWRDAKNAADFITNCLRELAKHEVREMNWCEEHRVYGYRVEHKETWTKLYDNGEIVSGYDWVTDESVSGALLVHANDLDFPKCRDVPVFYEDGVWLEAHDAKGLAAYEYIIPEFVLRFKDRDGNYRFCQLDEHGIVHWVTDIQCATPYDSVSDVRRAALSILGTVDYGENWTRRDI